MLLLLAGYMPAYSDQFTLNIKMDNIELDQYLLYFEDPSGNINFDEILNSDQNRFSILKRNKTAIGYTDSTFWFKLIVKNNNLEPLNWIFESKYPLLDYITLYIPAEFGFIEITSGDRLPFETMPMKHYNFASKIKSAPGISTIYFKVKSEGSVVIKLRAWDYDSFLNNLTTEGSLLWLFYGVMIALLFYNFFIYTVSKDKSYLYLTLFIFSVVSLTFIHNGIARQYFWPDAAWWANHSHPISVIFSSIFLIRFSQIYLNTSVNAKVVHRILNAIVYISIPFAIISMFTPYNISTRLSVIIMMISPVVLIITTIPVLRIELRITLYYLGSWTCFIIGVMLIGLRSFGILPNSFMTDWSYLIGIAFANIFLSIGLADKIGTLKKENEKALLSLKESEERYRLFFETAHDGIMYFINDIPVFANNNMLKMAGYSNEDFYKKNVYDFFISDTGSPDNVNDQIKKVSSGEIPNTQFGAILNGNENTKIDVLISISYLAVGTNRGIFMIITDISSLKNASNTIQSQYDKIQAQFNSLESLNKELVAAQSKLITANTEVEKEKEFLSATLLSIGDGVVTYDIEGKIFLMNKVAEEMTGVTSKEAMGKHIKEILKLSGDSSNDLFFDTLGKVTDKYRFNNIGVPFKMIDKDGNERIVEINSAIINLDNKPHGIVLALRDITIKSKIDNELIKMSKLESIGILAGGIAHDFNNLLTGISGNISIMKNQVVIPEGFAETLLNIEKAVDRAAALTKQLLTFAKGGEPILSPSSLADIINESAKFIIKNPDIKCELDIEENLRPVMIDSNQISQAINNLLINSIQAMDASGIIKIEARNIEKLPAEILFKTGSYVMLKISDTGCGISKKNVNKIFDPFYSTKSSGTGLGLTSTYSIIKKHRGYIEVTSEENKGTTFKIYLKSADTQIQKNETITETSKELSTGSVLIMDDEIYILEVLVKMLKHQGFTVDSAKNGEEAINLYSERLAQNKPYDYVILDLTVYGGMGGKETIAALKKINPDIKAIVSSGYSDNPVMANYKEYGFSGVLTKPYAIEDIMKVLKEK
jgi:PAS domain S-box-containing protein